MPRPRRPSPGAAAALLAVLLSPAAAHAEFPGVSLAARVGYTLPSVSNDADVSARYTPVQLDAMARLPLGFAAGVYGSYGFPGPDNGGDFSGLLRLGVQVHYRVPLPVVHPWVGVGTGYARNTPTQTTTAVDNADLRPVSSGGTTSSGIVSRRYTALEESGWEPFNLQAGLQFSLLSSLELGPFVQYEYGTSLPRPTAASVILASGPVTTKSTATPEEVRVTRLTFGLRAELVF